MYTLETWAIGNQFKQKITQEEYLKLTDARKILSAGLAMEEKYEILISNYLDFEKESLTQTMEHMLSSDISYEKIFQATLTFNTRLVNLLTSTRLYIDQIHQHVAACSEDSVSAKAEIKKTMSEMYDTYFEYRFMEALRNFVQHRGLAVHSISFAGNWTSIDKPDSELEYRAIISTLKSKVSGDKAFKTSVYKEMPSKVNISDAARVYVASLNKVHTKARELGAKALSIARAEIVEAIICYEDGKEDKSIGLYAVHRDKDIETGRVLEKFPLMLDWDDMREKLTQKNSDISNLKKWVVTSSMNRKK